MTSKNQDQIARRKATQEVIAANRAYFEERMRFHYEEMGLGEWKPRLSPEERAAVKAREAQDKAVAQIKALAEKAGVGVVLVEDPDIQKKLDSAADGTFEGVQYPWDQDEPSAEPEPETDEQRDERLAQEADAASQQV